MPSDRRFLFVFREVGEPVRGGPKAKNGPPTKGPRVASKNASSAGIAQRYAGALYELASPQWLDAVAGDLKTFEEALAAVPELKRMTNSPLLPRATQEKAVLAVMANLGIGGIGRAGPPADGGDDLGQGVGGRLDLTGHGRPAGHVNTAAGGDNHLG
jgi:hypothetical protein